MQKGSFLRREVCVVICTLPGNGPNQTMIDSCRRFSQVEWQGLRFQGLIGCRAGGRLTKRNTIVMRVC